jgi:hypothetical protein
MPRTDDVIDVVSDLLRKRLTDIETEERRLARAVERLDGTGATPRPRKRRRRGRRKGGRREQALAIVIANPGVTLKQIAANLKMAQPAYLYSVLADLEKGRLVNKADGGGYYPTERAKREAA